MHEGGSSFCCCKLDLRDPHPRGRRGGLPGLGRGEAMEEPQRMWRDPMIMSITRINGSMNCGHR